MGIATRAGAARRACTPSPSQAIHETHTAMREHGAGSRQHVAAQDRERATITLARMPAHMRAAMADVVADGATDCDG